MRHPLHVAVPVSPPDGAVPRAAARHRKPRPDSVPRAALAGLARVPPARRLAAGLGLAGVLVATALTAWVEPAAPVAPDRVPAGRSSTFAQVSRD
ncbi:hypothetical protein Slala03_11340 [Streptomyces lavendulae subsp. lavendulae]|uniref:hypothetical protein n=1 Tax=Streptomyces lavendulae TaxID=1914 RepID=UPI0024A1192E|nr:hypothetical protein [Streptomyces lavendulae]GLV81445.1 hypothetical protein Slala03_11340 [Streptomyces lavendulae subsp. lavendulae]